MTTTRRNTVVERELAVRLPAAVVAALRAEIDREKSLPDRTTAEVVDAVMTLASQRGLTP